MPLRAQKNTEIQANYLGLIIKVVVVSFCAADREENPL